MTTFDEPHPANCCCIECARKPHRQAFSSQGIPVEDLPFNVVDSASAPIPEETFMKITLDTHVVEMPRQGATVFCKVCGHSGAVLTAIPCEPPAEWWNAPSSSCQRRLDAAELYVTGSMAALEAI